MNIKVAAFTVSEKSSNTTSAIDGWMDEWMDGWRDRWTDGPTIGRTMWDGDWMCGCVSVCLCLGWVVWDRDGTDEQMASA